MVSRRDLIRDLEVAEIQQEIRKTLPGGEVCCAGMRGLLAAKTIEAKMAFIGEGDTLGVEYHTRINRAREPFLVNYCPACGAWVRCDEPRPEPRGTREQR